MRRLGTLALLLKTRGRKAEWGNSFIRGLQKEQEKEARFSETELGWEIHSPAMSWGKNQSSQESQFRGGEAAVFPKGLGGDSLPFLDP